MNCWFDICSFVCMCACMCVCACVFSSSRRSRHYCRSVWHCVDRIFRSHDKGLKKKTFLFRDCSEFFSVFLSQTVFFVCSSLLCFCCQFVSNFKCSWKIATSQQKSQQFSAPFFQSSFACFFFVVARVLKCDVSRCVGQSHTCRLFVTRSRCAWQ